MLRLPFRNTRTQAAEIAASYRQLLAIGLIALTCCGVSQADEFVLSEPLSDNATEIEYSLQSPAAYDDCDACDAAGMWGGLAWPRFGMYLKAGPSFQLGDGMFEDGTKVGYEIQFGGRELWVPYNRQVFLDLGASYLSAFGRGPSHTVAGVIDRSTLGPLRIDEFLDLRLEEISRASLHAGVGWYHDFSSVPDVNRILTLRFGGRLSHVRGHFNEIPTADLQDAIDTSNLLGEGFSLAKDKEIAETDTAPGIFAGVDLSNTWHESSGATIAFIIDAEFASDWIEFQDYTQSALVTANILFGLSVNR